MEKIDLHLHTNISDGVLNPESVIKLAKQNNCFKIAITDHDIIQDYSELEKQNGISIISGIEFNTSIRNMHILGYGITNIKSVNDRMIELRLLNEQVCREVMMLMNKGGYDISYEQVSSYLKDINLSHNILDKRKIVKYLIYKGYASGVLDAYDRLIGFGQEFYVPNYKITPREVIDLINENNGFAVLAHPNTIDCSMVDLVDQVASLKEKGLAGIEVINGKMNLMDVSTYNEIAQKFELIKTVGSDFHNPQEHSIGILVQEEIYDNFQKKLQLSNS